MRRIIIILSLLFFGISLFGQKTIHGLILDSERLPLPGTTIFETNTQYSTITDSVGKFIFTIHSDTSCLKISFVGFKDSIICHLNDTIPPIVLKQDKSLELIDIVHIDYQYVRNSNIGYYGGLKHTPYGFSLSNFTPYLFKIPLMTIVQFDYKTNLKNNNDFHFGIARYFGRHRKRVQIGFAYDFDNLNIVDDNLKLDFKNHKIYSSWNYKRTYLFLGFGYGIRNDNTNNGLLAGLAFEIPKIYISLFTLFDYWYDYSSYSVDLYKIIPKTRFSLGAGFKQLNGFNEINLRVRYEIRY